MEQWTILSKPCPGDEFKEEKQCKDATDAIEQELVEVAYGHLDGGPSALQHWRQHRMKILESAPMCRDTLQNDFDSFIEQALRKLDPKVLLELLETYKGHC